MPTPQITAIPAAASLSGLVERIAHRNHAAFSRLYHLLVRHIFAQVRDSLGSPALAVPATRAVFTDIWRLAPAFSKRDDVTAWLTAITTRHATHRHHTFTPTSPTPAEPATITQPATATPPSATSRDSA